MAREMTGPCKPEWLNLYADGEVPETQASILQEHLRNCAACRRALAGIQQMKALTKAVPVISAPEAIRSRAKAVISTACASMQPLLGSYLDGELPAAEKESLILHLALCRNCSSELQTQKQLRQVVLLIPQAEVPLQVRERVAAALAARKTKPSVTRNRPIFAGLRRLAPASALAGLALLLAVLQPVFFQSHQPDSNARLEIMRTPAKNIMQKNIIHTTKPASPAMIKVASKPQTLSAAWPTNSRSSNGTRRTVVAKKRRLTDPLAVYAAAGSSASSQSNENTVTRASVKLNASTKTLAPVKLAVASTDRAQATEAALPLEIAKARLEMLQASERYQALRSESQLTSLPAANEVLKVAPPGTTAPAPGPKAEFKSNELDVVSLV